MVLQILHGPAMREAPTFSLSFPKAVQTTGTVAETNQPGVLLLTYSRAMTLADAMRSGITPARVSYGDAYVNASRFIRELGPSAPPPRVG
jgi:hypothetical protein